MCRRLQCRSVWLSSVFFFQAEDGIRYLVRSRGLGDVYKRQLEHSGPSAGVDDPPPPSTSARTSPVPPEPIVLVGDGSVGADDASMVGLRMGDAGLVCRPEPPEHVVVELNLSLIHI